jgi:hypothetical protein
MSYEECLDMGFKLDMDGSESTYVCATCYYTHKNERRNESKRIDQPDTKRIKKAPVKQGISRKGIPTTYVVALFPRYIHDFCCVYIPDMEQLNGYGTRASDIAIKDMSNAQKLEDVVQIFFNDLKRKEIKIPEAQFKGYELLDEQSTEVIYKNVQVFV